LELVVVGRALLRFGKDSRVQRSSVPGCAAIAAIEKDARGRLLRQKGVRDGGKCPRISLDDEGGQARVLPCGELLAQLLRVAGEGDVEHEFSGNRFGGRALIRSLTLGDLPTGGLPPSPRDR